MSRLSGWFAQGRPIWLYLALFSVAIIVPGLLGSGYLLYRFADAERQVERTQFLGEAALIASNLNREISNSLTTLRLLAASPDLDKGDFASFHARATAALKDTDLFVLLLDRSHKQLMNTRVPYGTALGFSSDPKSPEAAFREAQSQISDIFVGKVADQPVFNVTLPVIRDGEVIYVLILTRNASSLAAAMTAQTSLSTSLVTLVDSRNKIIARSQAHNDFVNKPLSPAIAEQLLGYLGVATVEEADGSRWLIAHQRLLQADWRVIIGRPLAASEANLFASLGLLIASGLALLVLSIMSAFLFGRYMATPIRELARQGRALGERRSIPPLHSHLQEANEVSAVLKKAAEERERHEAYIGLLMDELRHRSKNQFAVIQSLTRMTAKSSDDLDDFQKRFLPRVRSLADSLELLDDREWQGIDIRSLARAQMRSFDDTGEGRIKIDGPSLSISSQAAQSLGLTLHELGTNATKYGALSTKGGRIAVQWGKRQPDEHDEPLFWMRWRESGGPLVAAPTRTGFGSTVIDQMICHATDGKVTLSFEPEGLVWDFECCVSNLVKAKPSPDQHDAVGPATASMAEDEPITDTDR